MNLALSILYVLRNSEGFLLPRNTLIAEVRMVDSRHTLAEIETAMRDLEGAGQIIGATNPDAAGGSKWKITDAGKMRLAEAGV